MTIEDILRRLEDFLLRPLFELGDYALLPSHLLTAALVLFVASAVAALLARIGAIKMPFIDQRSRERVGRILRTIVYGLALLVIVLTADLDFVLYETRRFEFRLSNLFEAFLLFKVAQLLDWVLARTLINRYYKSREEHAHSGHVLPQKEDARITANRTIQQVVYVLSALLIIQTFDLDVTLRSFTLKSGVQFDFNLSRILVALLIISVARLMHWVLANLVLYNYFRRHQVDIGAQYAINQLLAYVFYIIASLLALERLGIELTLIWGAAAALLVGVGLGLQQTFNDLISGIILLFDRGIKVGDIVEVNGVVGTVRRIGIRSSLVESRDNVSIVVPNSKFIVDNVINWSHNDDKLRFHVKVGVAYGSDTALVKTILLEAAEKHESILDDPAPFVWFSDFGDSALIFELHFWSRRLIPIEGVKSDLRFVIDQGFREHGIHIPFPQRELWLRNGEELAKAIGTELRRKAEA